MHKGFSHIGLSTLDLDQTRDFYENVLKFKAVRCDTLRVKEGGQIRHIFFDTGRDQLIAFMEARQERAEISIRRLGLTGAGTPTPVESAKAG